ncbi:MAG: HlyD family type I secretion periplasmic adaptor subunit [Porticoccaceae bacterium]
MNVKAALPQKSASPELETSDKKPRTIGLIILLVSFGLFGTWAAFAPLDSASLAPGVVVVKGQRKTVQHYEGGIVQDILVTDGEHVEEDQPLVILDNTQFGAELGILRGQLFTAAATESRLIAERDDKEAILFSPELDSKDVRAEEAKRNEEQIFNARMAARQGEKKVLEQRIIQLKSQIAGLESLVKSQLELSESYQEEIKDLSELLDDGFVEKTRLMDLQRSDSRTRGEIAEQKASIAQLQVKIGETELEILQLNKRFKTEVVDELAKAQAQVFDVRQRIVAIQNKVERTVVKAPVSGRVLGLNAHTIGGVVNAGTPILDIVPDNQELIVEAKVNPADIDRVDVGLEANIRFTAFHTQTTPVIPGRVVRIAADRLVDDKTGQPYYGAVIEVTEEGLRTMSGLTLVPGMPAEVLIKTGERTLLQYLLQPARDAMARSLIEE